MTAAPAVRVRLEETRAAIREAARRAGREDDVKLVAVTKTVVPELVLEAYEAGQRIFGENRVQEAVEKIERLGSSMPDAVWHLIGHLQTNKAKQAVHHFPVIESVDSMKLATRLDGFAASVGHRLEILLEVNVAGEASKSGFSLETLRRSLPDLVRLPHLDLRGLMTVAPLGPNPEEVRWVFRTLRQVRDELRETHFLVRFEELSMGMSGDFPVAIEEGATIVRIGRALFGERG